MKERGMDEAYRNLWFAVLEQAIIDVTKYNTGFTAKSALSWFEGESKEIGSFHWICSVLNLNPEWIKMLIKPRMI